MSLFTNKIGKNPDNKYYLIKVSSKGASVYQGEDGQISNFDLKKAFNVVTDDKTSYDVKPGSFYTAMFYAANIFSQRVANSRRLFILSCGNCPRYNALDAYIYGSKLNERNIQVIAYGDYKMVDEDSVDSDDIPIGYGQGQVYLYNEEDKNVENDNYDSYKIDHRADMCQRFASKTNGFTYNMAYLNKPGAFMKVSKKVLDLTPKSEINVNQCVRFQTPLGDFDDFSYSSKSVENDSE